MNIGAAIRAIRTKAGINQGVLAERLDISQTALSQIEKGNSNPSERTLKKFSEIMDIPIPMVYILAIDGGDVPEAKKELYEKLFPSIRELALSLLS